MALIAAAITVSKKLSPMFKALAKKYTLMDWPTDTLNRVAIKKSLKEIKLIPNM